ncbi:MAG: hypothetical protein RID91_10125 [Azospirillaceae bacterium]
MHNQSDTLERALEAVSAMSEAGFASVPSKPTAAMLAAGARAGNVSVETAWKVYQAMLRNAD